MKTCFYILYVAKEIVNPGEDDVEEIFYVGRTSGSLEARLTGHLRDGRKQKFLKGQYIFDLLKKGREVKIKEVLSTEVSDPKFISNTEDSLIASYKAMGYELKNVGRTAGAYKGKRGFIEWTPERIRLIGTKGDVDIAKQLGCSPSIVRNKRLELGIPSFVKPFASVKHLFTPEVIALMGTMADNKLAKIIGCTTVSVKIRRDKLGISPYGFGFKWTVEFIAMLGTTSDAKLAETIGCTQAAVTRKRKLLNILSFKDQEKLSRQ